MNLKKWIKDQRDQHKYSYGSVKEHNETCMKLIEALMEPLESDKISKLAELGLELGDLK